MGKPIKYPRKPSRGEKISYCHALFIVISIFKPKKNGKHGKS
jgi:hypothetical protein